MNSAKGKGCAGSTMLPSRSSPTFDSRNTTPVKTVAPIQPLNQSPSYISASQSISDSFGDIPLYITSDTVSPTLLVKHAAGSKKRKARSTSGGPTMTTSVAATTTSSVSATTSVATENRFDVNPDDNFLALDDAGLLDWFLSVDLTKINPTNTGGIKSQAWDCASLAGTIPCGTAIDNGSYFADAYSTFDAGGFVSLDLDDVAGNVDTPASTGNTSAFGITCTTGSPIVTSNTVATGISAITHNSGNLGTFDVSGVTGANGNRNNYDANGNTVLAGDFDFSAHVNESKNFWVNMYLNNAFCQSVDCQNIMRKSNASSPDLYGSSVAGNAGSAASSSGSVSNSSLTGSFMFGSVKIRWGMIPSHLVMNCSWAIIRLLIASQHREHDALVLWPPLHHGAQNAAYIVGSLDVLRQVNIDIYRTNGWCWPLSAAHVPLKHPSTLQTSVQLPPLGPDYIDVRGGRGNRPRDLPLIFSPYFMKYNVLEPTVITVPNRDALPRVTDVPVQQQQASGQHCTCCFCRSDGGQSLDRNANLGISGQQSFGSSNLTNAVIPGQVKQNQAQQANISLPPQEKNFTTTGFAQTSCAQVFPSSPKNSSDLASSNNQYQSRNASQLQMQPQSQFRTHRQLPSQAQAQPQEQFSHDVQAQPQCQHDFQIQVEAQGQMAPSAQTHPQSQPSFQIQIPAQDQLEPPTQIQHEGQLQAPGQLRTSSNHGSSTSESELVARVQLLQNYHPPRHSAQHQTSSCNSQSHETSG